MRETGAEIEAAEPTAPLPGGLAEPAQRGRRPWRSCARPGYFETVTGTGTGTRADDSGCTAPINGDNDWVGALTRTGTSA